MHIAHIGIAVFVIGVTMVKGFETERDIRLAPGEAASAGGYEFKFIGISQAQGPNYQILRGRFEVSKNGKLVEVLSPEKRAYVASGQTMTEAAIDSGFTRDLYVSLGEPVEGVGGGKADGAWGVRIYVKPFINWIWLGCLFMAFGGGLAVADKRYRLRVKQHVAVSVSASAAASVAAEKPVLAGATVVQPSAGD